MAGRTVREVDSDLMRARQAYLDAEERGDLIAATERYDELDQLLEERLHVPLQRDPSRWS